MTSIKIIIFAVILAIGYGIVHDLITSAICIEYFTIGHPKTIESNSPILLSFAWGTIATWWVGLPLGIEIAIVSQFGKKPKVSFSEVKSILLKLITIMFMLALISGIISYIIADHKIIYLSDYYRYKINNNISNNFLAVGWAHTSSYISGFFGSLWVCFILHKKRKKI